MQKSFKKNDKKSLKKRIRKRTPQKSILGVVLASQNHPKIDPRAIKNGTKKQYRKRRLATQRKQPEMNHKDPSIHQNI